MALVLADRVLETTTSVGSGTITLAGAKTGYQSFSVVGDGNQTYYTIAGPSEWEVGIGTYTASGTTLSRDTVLSSSSGGSKVTFSSGVKNVFADYPAGKSVYKNTSDVVEITTLQSVSATITTLAGTSANITTITENGSSVVVQTDIGTAPNQVPLNQYLGSMAYQDDAAITVGQAVITSLTLSSALPVSSGGTGTASTPTNGQLLIGNGSGFSLSTLTAGSGMTIENNAGSITLSAGGLPPVTVSNTTTISAVAGNHYVLTAATTATVTLPASPTISDTVWVTVANGLTTNVVARNGKNIQGIAEDMTLNSAYAAAQLRFSDNTEGWILI